MRCKGCGANIKFLATRRGALMPVDPARQTAYITDLAPEGRTPRRLSLLAEDGAMNHGWEAEPGVPRSRAITGYVPHWATCPKASEFR